MINAPGYHARRLPPAVLALMFPLAMAGCGEKHSFSFTGHGEGLPIESLHLGPQGRTLGIGESLSFVPVARDPQGDPLEPRIYWSAMGGQIDEKGVFVAGSNTGSFQVVAETRTPDPTFVAVAVGTISAHAIPPLSLPNDGGNEGEPAGDPTPANTSDLIFLDDFETGDFRKWGENAPLGDPFASGEMEGGAHIGFGFITDEMAHRGRYSWRAQVDPHLASNRPGWPIGKASLERWGITDGFRDFTVSAWYYFPVDYPEGVWTNLMQLKARQKPHIPTTVIAINQDRELVLFEGIHETTVKASSAVVPLGRWVQITTHFVVRRWGGQATTWIDGHKVLDVGGLNTLGHTTTGDVYFGVGNYVAQEGVQRCHVYIDDVTVSLGPPG
ncbi:MAG: hypothetical protein ACREMD_08800 [Gemmatimonadota bacterium]